MQLLQDKSENEHLSSHGALNSKRFSFCFLNAKGFLKP
jgi:hypothetical protein